MFEFHPVYIVAAFICILIFSPIYAPWKDEDLIVNQYPGLLLSSRFKESLAVSMTITAQMIVGMVLDVLESKSDKTSNRARWVVN